MKRAKTIMKTRPRDIAIVADPATHAAARPLCMVQKEIAKGAGGHTAGSSRLGAVSLADKTLTWVNRQPSAPLWHGPVVVRRTVWQDFQ